MKSDKEIWNDFRKGKDYALSHIYHQHVQSLFRYGKKFSSDDELVKDTIQDLFLDLIRTRENLGKTDNICFYLLKSFRRKLTKNMKDEFPQHFNENFELTPEIVYSAEHEFIQKEELTRREQLVNNALSEISPRQREILYYKFNCNFEYDQICEIMNIKYDSARKQVSRALKAMKAALSDKNALLLFLGFFSWIMQIKSWTHFGVPVRLASFHRVTKVNPANIKTPSFEFFFKFCVHKNAITLFL